MVHANCLYNPLQLRYVVILQMDKKDISSKAPRL